MEKTAKLERKCISQAKADLGKREEMDLLHQELKRLKEKHTQAQVFALGAAASMGLHGVAAIQFKEQEKPWVLTILIQPIALFGESASSNETAIPVYSEDWMRIAILLG